MSNYKDKAKKLLAMMNGAATENEAKVAALKLQRLLAEHNLSMAEVEEPSAAAPVEVDSTHAARIDAWKSIMGLSIARNFRCEVYTGYGFDHKTYRRIRRLIFLGMPEDAQLAAKTHEVMCNAALNCWKTFAKAYSLRAAQNKRDYLIGFAKGVGEALDAARKSDATMALVLIKPEAVTKAAAELGLRTQHLQGANRNNYSYGAGYRDGQSAATKTALAV